MKHAFSFCFGRRIGALVVLGAMTLAPIAPSHAEIEPKYYRQMQDRASEQLVIRVLSVRTAVSREKHQSGSFTLVNTRVEAEARVEKVERTGSGLKPGDTIRIQYVSMRPEPAMPGPRPIPVIKAGETHPAFLLGVSKGLYGAGARGATFEKLIDAK
jgi:hypothetical protein